jgi:hypothetical protein
MRLGYTSPTCRGWVQSFRAVIIKEYVQAGAGLNFIRSRAATLLSRLANLAERHPQIALLLLVVVYLPAAFEASRSAPLWHDELFTYYIAQSRTLGQMWSSLRAHDLNPPLMYLLTRWSFAAFGVNTLAARLPEIGGFLLWIVCTYQFVRRRMGVAFGVFAVMVLLEGDAFQFGVDARPYALVMGFLGLAMLGYHLATEASMPGRTQQRRVSGLCALAAGTLGMILSHMVALPAIGALAAAEMWRMRARRRVDWAVAIVLLSPLALLAVYLPMFRNHAASIFPPAFQPDGETIFDFYIASVSREMVALGLTALLVLALLGRVHLRGGVPARGPRWFFSGPEWMASIALLAAPLLLIAHMMATHEAFFPRYGIIATEGVIVATTALLARWTMDGGRPDGRAALLGAGVLLLMSGLWMAIPQELRAGNLIPTVRNSEPQLEPCEACRETAALDPTLPLVDASGLTFIEMNHRETPATLARLYYLTDPAASTEYAHASIFEPMAGIVRDFGLQGHAMAYPDFVRHHHRFFVLGRYAYAEDWLLRKLTADKANLRLVGSIADGYRDTELYEVTMADQ